MHIGGFSYGQATEALVVLQNLYLRRLQSRYEHRRTIYLYAYWIESSSDDLCFKPLLFVVPDDSFCRHAVCHRSHGVNARTVHIAHIFFSLKNKNLPERADFEVSISQTSKPAFYGRYIKCPEHMKLDQVIFVRLFSIVFSV